MPGRTRALLLLVVAACGGSAATPSSPDAAPPTEREDASAPPDRQDAAPSCPAFDAPISRGALSSPDVSEASGLVASRAHPGVLWVHNDSGDAARFFGVRADDGAVLGAVAVDGASAVDWEDIAAGALDGAPSIFLADIGDNLARRASVDVYVVPEPTQVAPLTARVSVSRRLTLTYEDGARDAEALLVDPESGALVVIEKSLGPAGVYTLAPPFAPTGILRRVATLDLSRAGVGTLVTGADVSPDGAGVYVRTYGGALFFAGRSVTAALSGAPCPVNVASERQGEAIAASFDGRFVFTVSEGVSQPLFATARR